VADRGDQDVDSLEAVQRRLRRSATRLVAAGLLLAAVVFLAGRGLIAWRFGDDEAVLRRGQQEVREQFEDSSTALQRVARQLAAAPDLIDTLTTRRENGRRTLFDLVERMAASLQAMDSAVTVFDANGNAQAWSGPSSDIPIDRLTGPATLFVIRGPLGLRLVHVEPVTTPVGVPLARGAGMAEQRRLGVVAAEQPLSAFAVTTRGDRDSFPLQTSVGPVMLRQTFASHNTTDEPQRFVLRAASGEALLEATVPANAAQTLRTRWEQTVRTTIFIILGLTLLLVAASCVFYRASTRAPAFRVALTLMIFALVIGARALWWWASAPDGWADDGLGSASAYASVLLRGIHRSPLDLLLSVLAFAALVIACISPLRWYAARTRGTRLDPSESAGMRLRCLLMQLLAGAIVLALQLGAFSLIGDTVKNANVHLLRLTLLPWNSARFALLVALIVLQASTVWLAVMVLRVALAGWRIDRGAWGPRLLVPAMWVLPSIAATWVLPRIGGDFPRPPIVFTALLVAAAAYGTRRGVAWYRHGSQATRLAAMFLALLVPAWFLYPSLVHFVDLAKRRLIETQYALETRNHPTELLAHLTRALTQIDQVPRLGELVQSLNANPKETAGAPPSTEPAFTLWNNTDLEQFRLTSAVELYGDDDDLISRFALNFPQLEAAATRLDANALPPSRRKGCKWEVSGEAAPVGADERRMLHAERGICVTDPDTGRPRVVGAVVVYVMLDYSALRFISSQSPYFEFLRGPRAESRAGTAASDVELAVYGWGHTPIYTSANRAWQLDDEIFERAYKSREPFWTVLSRGDGRDYAYVSNDRPGIYVLGYPVITTFSHLVHLAEISTLSAIIFVLLISGAAIVRHLFRHGPYPAELLVREVRTSFYRKLFLAFVAAAVVPVLTLALLVRTYFVHQLRDDVESEALRTAAVAKRLTEESIALQERQTSAPSSALTDDAMVWISRVINQDVNVFDGPKLLVTSERDLFASGLLPIRTPDSVYRAIALQRLPNYIDWEEIGGFPYLMAAAPVQAGSREAILTVPLAARQREIDKEIDELDRGVHLGALVLILCGAGLGYWMAERIGDPVQRLTRATRRIAAGDLSARVVVKTADELQRLVEAFNRMAGELQRQHQQLERTHRLEAWAEMARQVAHDIKNPLTPIQLSAEHLRRVHKDRGQPLSPVLDNCVDTILSQVRLLRQIASEFSSFGTSPQVNRTPTPMRELVSEVVDPYRLGAAERVTFDVDVPDTLPVLSLDRMLISRAITNIVENALYAMPQGGTLTIRVWQEPAPKGTAAHLHQGDTLKMTIADTGVGMDEEAAKRVFEPYFSTKSSGTGLGLSIARRNIDLHGGTIAVNSRKGEGATVTITLPIGRGGPGGADRLPSDRTPSSAPAERPAPALRGGTEAG
jgi:signal transduction histidine kinase